MPFCSQCGSPLNDTGACERCTPTPQAQSYQSTPQPQPYQQVPDQVPYQAPVGQAPVQPKEPSPFTIDLIASIKGFFSAKPTDALTAAVNSTQHIWAVIGGAYLVFFALAMMIIPGQALGQILGGFVNSVAKAAAGNVIGGMASGVANNMIGSVIGNILPAGGLLGFGVLLSALSFFLWSGGIKGICAAQKIQVPFTRILNVVAIALIPSTVTLLVGLLFSLFWYPAAIVCILVGAVASTLMLYIGMQKLAVFQKSPFWLFMAVYAMITIVLGFIVAVIMIPTFTGNLTNIGNLLGGSGSNPFGSRFQ